MPTFHCRENLRFNPRCILFAGIVVGWFRMYSLDEGFVLIVVYDSFLVCVCFKFWKDLLLLFVHVHCHVTQDTGGIVTPVLF